MSKIRVMRSINDVTNIIIIRSIRILFTSKNDIIMINSPIIEKLPKISFAKKIPSDIVKNYYHLNYLEGKFFLLKLIFIKLKIIF